MAARAWPESDPVDAIMAVMERAFDPAFGEAWNRRQVADALLLGTSRHMLIAIDGTIGEHVEEAAGFYLTRSVLDEEELLLFAIMPEFRGRGLGTALLEQFLSSARLREIKRVFLEMRRSNTAASLYEKFGFRPVGERPSYYRGSDGRSLDAISYELVLG
jgi:[ribosomal protein S18]-alanine N-acetyltransferase